MGLPATAAFLKGAKFDTTSRAVHDDLAVQHGGLPSKASVSTPVREVNSSVKSLPVRLVSRVVPSGAMRIAAR